MEPRIKGKRGKAQPRQITPVQFTVEEIRRLEGKIHRLEKRVKELEYNQGNPLRIGLV